MFDGGEEALHYGFVPAAALGLHPAGELSAFQPLPVDHRPVLIPPICVEQELIRFDLAVHQRLVEGLQHQSGLHGGPHDPTEYPAALQINPDRQVCELVWFFCTGPIVNLEAGHRP